MSQESSTIFMNLLEDKVFQEMSAAGWLMGIPARIDQATVRFGRCARRIVNSRSFKPLVNLVSKGISAATHVPMPDSEIGSLIANKGYMPPIVPLTDLREKAALNYRRTGSALLIHPSAKLDSDESV
jgi:hypothetical protein